MDSPNAIAEILYLSRVEYNEEGREIIAEFSKAGKKLVERFKFYPKAFYSVEAKSKALVEEIMGLYDRKRFELSQPRKNVLEVKASTVKDLKKISMLLEKSLKSGMKIMEAERQFLLEKNWAYFDSFRRGKFGFEKIEGSEFPDARVQGFSEGLEKTAKQLLEFDRKTAEDVLEKAAFSGELCVPLNAVPETPEERAKTLLENFAFKSSFPARESNSKSRHSNVQGVEGYFENVSEIDFTPVLLGMICGERKNISFETMNCECCRPSGIEDSNVLPHSMIGVEFLNNWAYFESQDSAFAERMHDELPNKRSRIDRMKEWSLQSIPLGPFSKGEKQCVPLADALRLSESKKARICSMEKAEWHCEREQGFVSRELNALILKTTNLEDKMLETERSTLKEHKVLCSSQLSEKPEYLLDFFRKKCVEELLRAVVREIASGEDSAAKALNAMQAQKIAEFRQLARIKGEKVLQSGNSGILLKAERPMSLLKEFSGASKAMPPSVLKNHKGIVLY